jgi:hypothetical protein
MADDANVGFLNVLLTAVGRDLTDLFWTSLPESGP